MIPIKTTLSVIVPVYNTSAHIRSCLDSVIDKETSGYEIILVDDGSTDDSGKICDTYKNAFDFIKVVHKQNGGLASARNAGLEVAVGEYITFVDSDDFVEFDFVKSIKSFIAKYKSDILVISHFIDFTEAEHTSECTLPDADTLTAQESIPLLESVRALNMCWNKIYRADMINAAPKTQFLCNSEPGEDIIFNCLCFKKAKTVSLLHNALYHYVRRGEDTLANKFRDDLFEKNKVFIGYRNALYKNLLIEKTEIKHLAKGNIHYIFACIPNMYRSGKKMPRKRRLAFYREIIKSKDIAYWFKCTSPEGLIEKQLFMLYKGKSPFIMDSSYLFLMSMRNAFAGIWVRIRRKLLYEKNNCQRR